MKVSDCYVGQKVVFSYEGVIYVSVIKEIIHENGDRWIANLKNGDQINIRRLLGVVNNER